MSITDENIALGNKFIAALAADGRFTQCYNAYKAGSSSDIAEEIQEIAKSLIDQSIDEDLKLFFVASGSKDPFQIVLKVPSQMFKIRVWHVKDTIKGACSELIVKEKSEVKSTKYKAVVVLTDKSSEEFERSDRATAENAMNKWIEKNSKAAEVSSKYVVTPAGNRIDL